MIRVNAVTFWHITIQLLRTWNSSKHLEVAESISMCPTRESLAGWYWVNFAQDITSLSTPSQCKCCRLPAIAAIGSGVLRSLHNTSGSVPPSTSTVWQSDCTTCTRKNLGYFYGRQHYLTCDPCCVRHVEIETSLFQVSAEHHCRHRPDCRILPDEATRLWDEDNFGTVCGWREVRSCQVVWYLWVQRGLVCEQRDNPNLGLR